MGHWHDYLNFEFHDPCVIFKIGRKRNKLVDCHKHTQDGNDFGLGFYTFSQLTREATLDIFR